MTVVELLTELGHFIEHELQDFVLPVPARQLEPRPGAARIVQPLSLDGVEEPTTSQLHIYVGWVPLKTTENTGQIFPYVALLPSLIESKAGETHATVDIQIGVYQDEQDGQWQGHIAVINVAERLLNGLRLLHNGCLARQYLLDTEQEITVNFPAEQPHPFYYAGITTRWGMRAPETWSEKTEFFEKYDDKI